jgi:hypothetical protein
MNRASRLGASALLLAGAWPAVAQERRPNELPDPLLVRARAVSDDLTAEAPSLLLHDRALLWARLGEVWWKDDRGRARALMLKAVEEVEAAPEQEEAVARARRLAAARALLSVVGTRDRELSERLSAVLSARRKSAQATDGAERGQNAEALANAALEVLDADPRRAAELGSASFRAGGSSQQSALLLKLHKRDAGLAASLFREGLAAVRASHSSELWLSLAGAAFPHRLYFPPFAGPVFPEEMRADALRVLAENLLRPPASEEDDERVCAFAWTAASLVEEFAPLVPQQAGALRIAINRCQQKMSPDARRHLDGEMSEQKPKTVEEYLRAAAAVGDERLRGFQLARAASVAYSGGDPDRAIEIMEGMSHQQRAALGDAWETARWNLAAAAALKHFKAGDRQTVRRVLDAVPPKLRAYALIHFLNDLAESKPRDFPAELLGEVRLLLSRYEGPEAPPYLWLSLVRLYATYLPADGPRVFNEAVAGLNRWGRTRPAGAAEKSHEFPEYPWAATNLHVALVEADEPGVTNAVAAIDDRLMRAWARLGLLKALLEKRQAEPSPPADPKSVKAARGSWTP